jgi:hypothetical protein
MTFAKLFIWSLGSNPTDSAKVGTRAPIRRALLLGFPQLHNPEPRIKVVEEGQSVMLSSPGEWQVGTEAFGITGPDAPDLPSLAV